MGRLDSFGHVVEDGLDFRASFADALDLVLDDLDSLFEADLLFGFDRFSKLIKQNYLSFSLNPP